MAQLSNDKDKKPQNDQNYSTDYQQIDSYDSNDEECDEEVIVTGSDSREKVTNSVDKNQHIIRCIGQVKSQFRYIQHEFNIKTTGTATVFRVIHNKAYALTAAHNVRCQIKQCNGANGHYFYKEPGAYCKKCGHLFKKVIIKATKFTFSRNETNYQSSYKKDGLDVIFHYGQTIETYKCNVEYVPDTEYEKAPHPGSGNDYAIISFIITDGYDYSKYSKHIRVSNDIQKLEKKQITNFRIFGYPNNEMVGMQSTNAYYSVKKHRVTSQKHLQQKEVDASCGQSGSALWYKTNENDIESATIFAIHTGGSKKKKFNAATIIDDKIIFEIEKLCGKQVPQNVIENKYDDNDQCIYCGSYSQLQQTHPGNIQEYHSGYIQDKHDHSGQLCHPGQVEYYHPGELQEKTEEKEHSYMDGKGNMRFYKITEKITIYSCCNAVQSNENNGCKSKYSCCGGEILYNLGCKWSCCGFNRNAKKCPRYSCCDKNKTADPCSIKYSCCGKSS
eukprot:221943_1